MFGFEIWNSYTSAYPYSLIVQMMNHTSVILSNQYGYNLYTNFNVFVKPTTIAANIWPGTGAQNWNYLVPSNMVVLLTNSVWKAANNSLIEVSKNGPAVFEWSLRVPFKLPQWQLVLSNNFTYVLSEGDRIVDFVWLTDLQSATDLTREMMAPYEADPSSSAGCWDTNRVDGVFDATVPTQGIVNQIDISMNGDGLALSLWNNWNGGPTQSGKSRDDAAQKFLTFLTVQSHTNTISESNYMQAPFSPIRRLSRTVTWQANDPLVHYHIADLTLWPTNLETFFITPPNGPIPTNASSLPTLGRMNVNYSPWGGNPTRSASLGDPTSYDRSLKDPGIRKSDDWDFPAGKFASIGWLGRVHRGTPWQTVYFKPEAPAPQNWLYQSRDGRTAPTNDWRLADLFTVATYDQATRGLLSINQTNLAAWSAVLAGTMVLTNCFDDNSVGGVTTNVAPSQLFTNLVIQPASSYASADPAANPVLRIHAAILAARARQPGGHFTSLSQLLQVPEFSVASPFLNQSDVQRQFALNDLAYEMLPTRLLSLFKTGDSRAMIQTWAQALTPCGVDAATGMPTNYKVMAEGAARTGKQERWCPVRGWSGLERDILAPISWV